MRRQGQARYGWEDRGDHGVPTCREAGVIKKANGTSGYSTTHIAELCNGSTYDSDSYCSGSSPSSVLRKAQKRGFFVLVSYNNAGKWNASCQFLARVRLGIRVDYSTLGWSYLDRSKDKFVYKKIGSPKEPMWWDVKGLTFGRMCTTLLRDSYPVAPIASAPSQTHPCDKYYLSFVLPPL